MRRERRREDRNSPPRRGDARTREEEGQYLCLLASRQIATLAASSLILLLTAACGPSPAPVAPTAPPTSRLPETDICKGSPPVPHALSGILRDARCDQDMYYSMSQVADQLGVPCKHCHAALASDPSKQDFPAPTPRKDIGNWMSLHLMAAIKPADGSKLHCRSCHTDEQGRPVAKILGNPRDPVRANEWMSLVMARRFVAADGSKLKCRSCHVGTPGTAEFRAKVILKDEQIPKHTVGGKGTPPF